VAGAENVGLPDEYDPQVHGLNEVQLCCAVNACERQNRACQRVAAKGLLAGGLAQLCAWPHLFPLPTN
jgi:hypothetical protein